MPSPQRLLFVILLIPFLSIAQDKQRLISWEKVYQEGERLENAGATSDAIAKYETSLKIAQESADHRGIGKNWIALGRIKRERGKSSEGIQLIQNAKKLCEQKGVKEIVAESLFEISAHYIDQSRYKEAIETAKQALLIGEELKNKRILSKAYRAIGNGFFYQGLFTQALEPYQKGLKYAEEANDPAILCYSLQVLAKTLAGVGKTDQAIQYFLQAIKIADQTGYKTILPRIHSGIADAYMDQGMYERATQHFRHALQAAEDAGSKVDMAMVLNNLGNLYWTQRFFDQALSYYHQSLSIAEELRHQRGVAILLSNLGALYSAEGLPEQALTYHLRALQMQEQIGDRYSMTSSLNNIGVVYANQKQYDRAIEYYQRALKITEEIGDKSGVTLVSKNLGNALLGQGEYQEAEKYFKRSLSLATEINYKEFIGFSAEAIGNVYLKLHKLSQATEYFQKALLVGEEITSPLLIWSAHYGLAKSNQEMGDDQKSLQSYQAAIDEIEKVRSRTSSEESKSGFLARNLEVYEDLIALLIELDKKYPDRNYDAQAYGYSERAKARALLDTLEEFRSGIRKGLSEEQQRKEIVILQKVSTLQSQLWGESDDAKQLEAKKKLQDAEMELDRFIVDLRLKNPEYTELKYPEPYDLKKAQKQIDVNTAVLQYFVGERHSYIFAIDAKELQIAPLPPKAQLEKSVRKYLERISKPPRTSLAVDTNRLQREFEQQSQALFGQLIAPVQKTLAGKQNLLLILDDALHYVPFETILMDRDRLIIESFRIAYAPSITIWANLKVKSKEQNSKQFIAFGDPILPSDSSESHGSEGSRFSDLRRLRYAREEVEGIASLYPQNALKIYLGEDATESKFKVKEISDYKMIHFATHAMIDEEIPRRSIVILSADAKEGADGVLQMHEIWNLNLNAELVVLSACQTGLGKLVSGEGMISLMRAFFYAGAKNVVVSLWNVDDKSTADLMKSFYIHMKNGKSQSESLRQAKLDMIRTAKSGSGYAAYKDPYYWAPFVLVGVGN
jgi:CHAT domain-containing protein/tetratricopeptide (TPR) repeat protein